jgi:hypothetical protein
MRIPRKNRIWVLLFSLWLAIEPLAIAVVRAEDALPKPEVNVDAVAPAQGIKEIMPPAEYLDFMLEMRGATKEEAEAHAWSDWLTTITGAYMMMEAGEHDVFTFYSAMRTFKDIPGTVKSVINGIKKALNKATLLFSFLGNAHLTIRGANLFTSFGRIVSMAEKSLAKSRGFQFLQFMAPPPCWNNPKVAGEGFKSYYHWVRKVPSADGSKGLTNIQGVARTCGIGLAILGLALDSYRWATSEDWISGRHGSYPMVKNYVGVAFGAAGLICMFCIPIVGQIVAAIALVWSLGNMVAGWFGEHNKKWKEAYKNSYWYLYQNDPEFKIYYDNRALLTPSEKTASLLLAERDFGDFLDAQEPKNEEEEKQVKHGKLVFEHLEKQGVLMSYYNQSGFTLPDFDMGRLLELWGKKADYMSWKPNEAEAKAAENRSFFGKIGQLVSPMTYISWAGNKLQSRGYLKEIKNNDIPRVFFNPDYVLVKKFKNYLLAKNLGGGLYDIVGLRLEQSPFNYIPLMSHDPKQWSEKTFQEAFNADAFIIGTKEMMFFQQQVKMANEAIKSAMKDSDRMVEKIQEDDLPHTRKMREALADLAVAYQDEPNGENVELFETCEEAFGWAWEKEFGRKTPKNILGRFKTQIEEVLAFVPLSLAQKAVDMVLLVGSLKHNLDTAKLMEDLGREKQDSLKDSTFNADFTDPYFHSFLKKGTFLDVKGSTFKDWLSDLYPPYEELRKYTSLFMKEVKKYSSMADEANSSERDGFLWFNSSVVHPKDLLQELNLELSAFKEVSESFEELREATGLKMAVSRDDPELYGKIYKEGGYQIVCEPVPMDVNQKVAP